MNREALIQRISDELEPLKKTLNRKQMECMLGGIVFAIICDNYKAGKLKPVEDYMEALKIVTDRVLKGMPR